MQFESFNAFLNMGGYGFYVWLSFGVSAALLLALIFSSILGHKQVIKNIAMHQQRTDKLRQARRKNKKSNTHTPADTDTEVAQ
ncbi:MAG: heme exporter protein CcmD [Colwellia sp.]|nr:heme exporter protein CcmD [Colwellia sp.]